MIVTLTIDRCFSSLLFSLYTYTYTYAYCYYCCILYSLVLTKPAPAWVLVKASFSTSDTIVTLYRHRSTNRFVSLADWPLVLSRVRLIRVRLVLINLNPINDTYMHAEMITKNQNDSDNVIKFVDPKNTKKKCSEMKNNVLIWVESEFHPFQTFAMPLRSWLSW